MDAIQGFDNDVIGAGSSPARWTPGLEPCTFARFPVPRPSPKVAFYE
jgi:hypothetical protein